MALKKEEDRQEDAAIRFRALFEHALDAILIADDEGRYVDANPAAAELFGTPREELLGKTAADFGPPDLDFAAVWRSFRESEEERGEFPIHRPDGSVRYAEYAAVPDFLPGRHLSILRDVTERLRLFKELQELTGTLEKRVEARTEALAQRGAQLRAVASALTVAEQRERERIAQILHDDLQQLLHATQARVVMLEAELGDDVAESVRETVAEVGRLNGLAQVVTRSLTVELSPPVLEGEGVLAALRWLADHMEKRYGLHVQVTAEEVDMASADLRELTFQMVRELLYNVVKHAEVAEAELDVRQREGFCQITVADQGSGFDPSLLGDDAPHGAGYGLRSIHERLALFGGALAVAARPGVGAAITLTIPCRSDRGRPGTEAGEE